VNAEEYLKRREAENLEALSRDVERARGWVREKFKTNPDSVIPSGYAVEFPDVDRLIVTPTAFGEPMEGAEAEFRLVWKGGVLYWVGDFALRRDLFGVKSEIRHRIGRAEGVPR